MARPVRGNAEGEGGSPLAAQARLTKAPLRSACRFALRSKHNANALIAQHLGDFGLEMRKEATEN
jgi:hypothetical protein